MSDEELVDIILNEPKGYERIKEMLMHDSQTSRVSHIVELLKAELVVEEEYEDEINNEPIKEKLRNIYEDFDEVLYSSEETNEINKNKWSDLFLVDDEKMNPDITYIKEDDLIIEDDEIEEEEERIDPNDILGSLLWSDLDDEQKVQEVYEKLNIEIEKTQVKIKEIKELIDQEKLLYRFTGDTGYAKLDQYIERLDNQVYNLEEKLTGLIRDISLIESVIRFHEVKKDYDTQVQISEELSKEEEELGIDISKREMGDE